MKSFFTFGILFCSISLYSQNIGINTTGADPDASAMLDIVSSDKGVLIPRVDIIDLTTAAPLTAPATSVLVYNTNAASGVGYYYWDASKWNRLYDETVNSEDHDWYEVGSTDAPNSINDDIFTQGDVGIGEILPKAKLDVNGDIIFGGTASSLEWQLSSGAGVFKLKNGPNYNGGETKLEGRSIGGTGQNFQLVVDDANSSGYPNYSFISDPNTGMFNKSGSPDNLYFSTGGTERLIIESTGDVGIGVSNPTSQLEIVDGFNGDVSVLKLRNSVGNGSIRTGVAIDFHHFNSATVNSQILSQQNGTSGYDANLIFSTESGDASVNGLQERMRIAYDGNVGIGTNNPTTHLEVSSGDDPTIIRLSETTGVDNNWELRAYNTALGPNNNEFSIWGGLASSTQTDRLVITLDGKVGIGNSNPTTKFDVNGDLRVRTIAAGTSSNDFLVADANGVVKTAPLVTNVTDGGANLRMYTGHSPSDGTGWVQYSSANGIYIDIDISACGFTNAPQIFTSMGGGSGSWTTSGSFSTYMVTATGFRVYINSFTEAEVNATIAPADADARNWFINWFAIGN